MSKICMPAKNSLKTKDLVSSSHSYYKKQTNSNDFTFMFVLTPTTTSMAEYKGVIMTMEQIL